MNTNQRRWAFVDESGHPSLKLDSPSNPRLYVITGVLVPEDELDEKRQLATNLSNQFFGGSELKSSSIGNNVRRRADLLKAIGEDGYKHYSIVVDKARIYQSSGLQYKKSFYKYLNRMFYQKLHRNMLSLSVRADEHGGSDFMASFKSYLQGKYSSELFEDIDFQFVPSDQEALVGVADMVSGSIRRIYEDKDSKAMLALLKQGTILIDHWPPVKEVSPIVGEGSEEGVHDDLIARQGVLSSRGFIEAHTNDDDGDRLLQVQTLKYLLWQYEMNPHSYISTHQLLEHISEVMEETPSEHIFRSRIIAVLRNEGVILASSPKGYKIPCSTNDMRDFVDLVNTQTVPYLQRLSKARNEFLLASNGEYDAVDGSKYPELNRIVDVLKASSPDHDR